MGGFGKGKRKYGNKRGEISVFLAMTLAALISLALIMSYAARSLSLESRADAIFRAAGRSIAAEYDRRLKEDYGILAFHGLGEDVEDKLRFYASQALPNAENLEIRADLSGGRLNDIEVFEEALIEAFKSEGLDMLGSRLRDEEQNEGKGGKTGAVLRNRAEIESLPSNFIEGPSFNTGAIESLSEEKILSALARRSGTDMLTNEYILRKFTYNYGCGYADNHFFQSEAEYILFGKYSDEQNMFRMKTSFIALRTGLNAAYIVSDPLKMEIITAASASAGPFFGLAEAAVIALWAGAEALNDWKLISGGDKVPVMKTEGTWALTLENAYQFGDGKGRIKPAVSEGLVYKDYLRLYLIMLGREKKLGRMMDLIQLNLRGDYYSGFRIRDFNTAFIFEADYGGKRYTYEERY